MEGTPEQRADVFFQCRPLSSLHCSPFGVIGILYSPYLQEANKKKKKLLLDFKLQNKFLNLMGNLNSK
jgi:hypothetical protein